MGKGSLDNLQQQVRANLASNVRRARLLTAATQEQVAEAARMTKNYVGLIERGQVNCSLEIIVQLAFALGVSPHVLLLDPGEAAEALLKATPASSTGRSRARTRTK